MTIRVLALCGSLRAKSTNRGLVRYAQAHAPAGMKIHVADLLDVPFYNADLAAKPAAVDTLLQEFPRLMRCCWPVLSIINLRSV